MYTQQLSKGRPNYREPSTLFLPAGKCTMSFVAHGKVSAYVVPRIKLLVSVSDSLSHATSSTVEEGALVAPAFVTASDENQRGTTGKQGCRDYAPPRQLYSDQLPR